jgi:hypothetical protein
MLFNEFAISSGVLALPQDINGNDTHQESMPQNVSRLLFFSSIVTPNFPPPSSK